MTEYKSLDASVESLQPNPWNSNIVSPDNERKIEESIKRLGMFKPITVRELADGSFEILGGQHRWEAAKRLGYKKVPVVNVGAVSDKKAKEIGLADNGRYGEDDTGLLSNLLNSLGETSDSLAEFLPYEVEAFDSLFVSATAEIDIDELDLDEDDEDIELPASTVAAQTHQIMRFKVPVADADNVTEYIEKVMRIHGFEKSDSLTNAGDALVQIINEAREK